MRRDPLGTSDAPEKSRAPGLRALWIVGVAMLALRIAYVVMLPDLDGDAYGHFRIAGRVLHEAHDVRVHWVWLPGWHYLLASGRLLGLDFTGVRFLHALLAAAGPFLLYRYARAGARSESTAMIAALAFSLSALPNLAGTSALMEVPFGLLILGAGLLLDRADEKRGLGVVAGGLLVLACSFRYEAWIAVGALACSEIVASWRRRALDFGKAAAVLLPALSVTAYVIARRRTDGEWLWFIRETYRFTHMQRNLGTESAGLQLAWFPILLPALLLGPALLLVPIGLAAQARPPLRSSTSMPVGIALFLVATHLGKGTLGHHRYLTVLFPFVCLAMADGIHALRSRIPSRRITGAALVSVTIATAATTWRVGRAANAQARELRDKELWAETSDA